MQTISDQMIDLPVEAFGLSTGVTVREIVDGLVHRTYLVKDEGISYILQKVNTYVFKEADKVLANIQKVTAHLENEPTFTLQVPKLKQTREGMLSFTSTRGDLWRCFVYIEGSTLDHLDCLEGAKEVARAFGQFSAALSSLSPDSLHYTIQGFHNPVERKAQFDRALREGKPDRISACREQIEFIEAHHYLADKINSLDLPVKISHNDPKLSNVLFDADENPCAIIDLDTVMPGSPLHDFGDLVRSMAASVPEDHRETYDVFINRDVYHALEKGFREGTGETLNHGESEHLSLGPAYIIYEQAMRFLADFLMGDIYYRIQFPDHNLVRAENQMALLKSFIQKILPAEFSPTHR